MEFRILGPFEAFNRDMAVDIRGGTYRKIVSLLLLDPGHAVSVSRLEDALWDDSPPATSARQVRNRVAALRRGLAKVGEDPIEAVGGGYRIAPGRTTCDAQSFTADLLLANKTAATGDLAAAVSLADRGLSRWRGSALMGMSGRVFESAAARLEESRLQAVERRCEWALSLGRYGQILGDLSELVGVQPFRQRLVGQLMQALHLSGRTAEAIGVYTRFRRLTADELGIEPGRSLRELYVSILRDEDLSPTNPDTGIPVASR